MKGCMLSSNIIIRATDHPEMAFTSGTWEAVLPSLFRRAQQDYG